MYGRSGFAHSLFVTNRAAPTRADRFRSSIVATVLIRARLIRPTTVLKLIPLLRTVTLIQLAVDYALDEGFGGGRTSWVYVLDWRLFVYEVRPSLLS